MAEWEWPTVRASGSVSLPLEYNCRPSWIYTLCYHHIWHELWIIIRILQRQWCFIISASIHMNCIFIQASEWMDGEMHSSLLYGHIEIIKKIPHFIPFDWEENLPFEGNVVSMHPADCRRRIALSRKQLLGETVVVVAAVIHCKNFAMKICKAYNDIPRPHSFSYEPLYIVGSVVGSRQANSRWVGFVARSVGRSYP